jgi:hypothetical protein
MDLIGLLKNVLLALTSYLELKSKTFYYDIQTKSKTKQTEIINEIEKLRNSKLDSDHDRADILRRELAKEKEFAEHLSTVYTLSGGR